jgi:hypothetical protein
LPLVSSLIDEKTHSRLGLAGPDVAFELSEAHQTQSIKPNVAVMALPDMPGKHAGARIVGGCLSELARTWNVAAAYVEPIADEAPMRDAAHNLLLEPARRI